MDVMLREWQVRSDIKVRRNGYIKPKLKFVSSAIARSLEVHQPQHLDVYYAVQGRK